MWRSMTYFSFYLSNGHLVLMHWSHFVLIAYCRCASPQLKNRNEETRPTWQFRIRMLVDTASHLIMLGRHQHELRDVPKLPACAQPIPADSSQVVFCICNAWKTRERLEFTNFSEIIWICVSLMICLCSLWVRKCMKFSVKVVGIVLIVLMMSGVSAHCNL